MFIVVCALPAAGVLMIPSAIAQEEDDDVSLLDDENEQDATNAGTSNPNQEQEVGEEGGGGLYNKILLSDTVATILRDLAHLDILIILLYN